jgi:hypothetical protein
MKPALDRPERARWLLLLLALYLAVGCKDGNLSQRLHHDAARALREQRLDDADAAFERALRYDPEDSVALEGLLELRLSRTRDGQAYDLVQSTSERALRSLKARNLALRAKLRAGQLAVVLADAAELRRLAALAPETERELLDALLAYTRDSPENPAWLVAATTPEPWLAATVLELSEEGSPARAASLLVAWRPPPGAGADRRGAKQALLVRLEREGWTLEQSLLDRLTAEPEQPLEYLGRLELLLATGRESEAARLEPARDALTDEWAPAWDLRWARFLARRSDWRGVLSRTMVPSPLPRREARRRALRCVAQQELGNGAAARAELAQWLAQPELARLWSEALLLPELTPYARALSALARRVDGEPGASAQSPRTGTR